MEGITELCEIAYKWGTDKCPQIKHVYTPYYYKIFNDRRNDIKKVLEMGIGNYKDMRHVERVFDPGLNRHYHRGASLYMWRDFFPNAQIYGADISPQTLFGADRISTFLCDELNKDDLEKLIWETGSDIDIFIDDGLHSKEAQIFLARNMLPLLDSGVTYVIEDVAFPDTIREALKEYQCEMPHLPNRRFPKSRLLVFRK